MACVDHTYGTQYGLAPGHGVLEKLFSFYRHVCVPRRPRSLSESHPATLATQHAYGQHLCLKHRDCSKSVDEGVKLLEKTLADQIKFMPNGEAHPASCGTRMSLYSAYKELKLQDKMPTVEETAEMATSWERVFGSRHSLTKRIRTLTESQPGPEPESQTVKEAWP